MAIWPFNRKKKESDLPKEVQDYYQAEKRERVGVAGLLAVATLLVTVVLAIGLFFGGRWLYRAIFDDDNTSNDTAQQEQQEGDSQEGEQEGQPEESGDQNDDQNNDGEGDQDGDEEAQPTTPAPTTPSTPAPSTPAPTTPATPPSNSGGSSTPNSLASTGPEDTAAIVASVAAISGTGFYLIRRKQEQE
jgi:cytoskeletal protein RodZ